MREVYMDFLGKLSEYDLSNLKSILEIGKDTHPISVLYDKTDFLLKLLEESRMNANAKFRVYDLSLANEFFCDISMGCPVKIESYDDESVTLVANIKADVLRNIVTNDSYYQCISSGDHEYVIFRKEENNGKGETKDPERNG